MSATMHETEAVPKLPPGVKLAPGDPEQNWLERLYLPEIAKGLARTLRHLVTAEKFTIDYDGQDLQDSRKAHHPSPGYRGEHYLKKDEAGHVKCVACFMCAAACPAECIHIEAEAVPADWKDRERFPARFEIDLLRCIYCGMCEEACPVDAIALSPVYNKVSSTRAEKIYARDKLLQLGEDLGLSRSTHQYRPDGIPGAVPERKAGH